MLANIVIIALVVWAIFREVVFLYSLNKLVNKIMAGSYREYKLTENIGKAKESVSMRATEDFPEDLGALEGIGVL